MFSDAGKKQLYAPDEKGGREICKNNLSRQVAEQIKNALFCGRLHAGQRVTELGLAREYDISQAPVREALQILISEGIIVQKGRQGKFIARPSPVEIKDSYFAGGVLEGAVVAAAIDRFGPAELAYLGGLAHEMQEAVARSDFGNLAGLDSTFHLYLFTMGGNMIVRDLWYRSCQIIGKYFYNRKWHEPALTNKVVIRHREIITAIETGRPELIEQTIRAHYVSAGEILAAFAGENAD